MPDDFFYYTFELVYPMSVWDSWKPISIARKAKQVCSFYVIL